MKLVVLDASVAIKWYVREDNSDEALELLDAKLLFFAPDLLFVEVAGALIRQHREYHQLTEDDVRRSIGDVLRAGIEVIPSRTLLSRAVEIALALGHLVRDCFYLALAERWESVMITADLQLIEKARRANLEKYVIALANVGEII